MSHFPYPTNLRIRTINIFRRMLRYQPMEKVLMELAKKFSIAKKFIPPEYLYPSASYRVVVRDGVKYQLDLSDVIGHSLYFFNRYFTPEQFVELIKKDWTVMDVGAHIGTSALRAALALREGTVYAFEPSSKNFEALIVNIHLNHLSNIVAIKKGIGSSNHKAPLYQVNSYNSGMNRLIGNQHDQAFEWVEIATLDEEIDRLKISQVDLIKIDAEGYELHVLQGAQKALKKFHPKLIIELVDVNLKSQGHTAADVVHFLNGFGYHCNDLKTGKPLILGSEVETDIFCFV